MKLNLDLIQRKLTRKLGRKATQNDIADLLGVTQAAISKMQYKDNNTLEMLTKVSNVLKVPIEKMIVK